MNGIDLAIYRAKKTIEQRNIALMDYLNSNEIKYKFQDNSPFVPYLILDRTDFNYELNEAIKEANAITLFLDATFVIQLDYFNEELTGNF